MQVPSAAGYRADPFPSVRAPPSVVWGRAFQGRVRAAASRGSGILLLVLAGACIGPLARAAASTPCAAASERGACVRGGEGTLPLENPRRSREPSDGPSVFNCKAMRLPPEEQKGYEVATRRAIRSPPEIRLQGSKVATRKAIRSPPLTHSAGSKVATLKTHMSTTIFPLQASKSSTSVIVTSVSSAALEPAKLTCVHGEGRVAVASILAAVTAVIITPSIASARRRRCRRRRLRGERVVGGGGGGGDDVDGGNDVAGEEGRRVINASNTVISAFTTSLMEPALINPSPFAARPPVLSIRPGTMRPSPFRSHAAHSAASTATVATFGIGGGSSTSLPGGFARNHGREMRVTSMTPNDVLLFRNLPRLRIELTVLLVSLAHISILPRSSPAVTVRRPTLLWFPRSRPHPVSVITVITVSQGHSTAGLRVDREGGRA